METLGEKEGRDKREVDQTRAAGARSTLLITTPIYPKTVRKEIPNSALVDVTGVCEPVEPSLFECPCDWYEGFMSAGNSSQSQRKH